jgi:hypothetical protein
MALLAVNCNNQQTQEMARARILETNSNNLELVVYDSMPFASAKLHWKEDIAVCTFVVSNFTMIVDSLVMSGFSSHYNLAPWLTL